MAGNNYTLSLSAQISQAGLASLQAQLDNFAKTYTMQVNTAIQQVQQATTQAATGGIGITESGGVTQSTTQATQSFSAFNTAVAEANNEVGHFIRQVSVYDQNSGQLIKQTNTWATGMGQTAMRVLTLNQETGEYSNVLKETTRDMANMDKATQGFGSQVLNAIEKMALWAIAGTLLFGTLRKIGDGIKYVEDLNKAMTNVQMVTGFTDEKINQLSNDYRDMALAIGSTTLAVEQANLTWLRQGKSAEDAAILTKASLEMSKLAMTDQAVAADHLTAILNGFQMQASDVNRVMDKMLALSNSTKTSAATSFDELSTAMQYSASVAESTGVTYDQLLSYIGVISSTTRQSAESTGQSLKTLFTRMEQIKAGASDEGDTLNNVQTVLQKYNMTLIDTTGNFKPLGNVIDEIGNKWNTMSEFEQRQIATAVAGEFLTPEHTEMYGN